VCSPLIIRTRAGMSRNRVKVGCGLKQIGSGYGHCSRACEAQESWVKPAERNDPLYLIRVIPAQEAALRALELETEESSMTRQNKAVTRRGVGLADGERRRGLGMFALIAIVTVLGIAIWFIVNSDD